MAEADGFDHVFVNGVEIVDAGVHRRDARPILEERTHSHGRSVMSNQPWSTR